MRPLRRWKRLWRRSLTCSYKRTSMGPSRSCWNGTTSALHPEEITSKETRVSCVYYQVPIRKKSGNIFNDPCMCYSWLFLPMGFKHYTTNGRSVGTVWRTMMKIKPYLVVFHESILVNLWILYIYIYIYISCGTGKIEIMLLISYSYSKWRKYFLRNLDVLKNS